MFQSNINYYTAHLYLTIIYPSAIVSKISIYKKPKLNLISQFWLIIEIDVLLFFLSYLKILHYTHFNLNHTIFVYYCILKMCQFDNNPTFLTTFGGVFDVCETLSFWLIRKTKIQFYLIIYFDWRSISQFKNSVKIKKVF